ncbi:MAG: hypothetical protein JSV65_19335 [Armatimonadota bacterium]|nr:MAG: hypothetical protein JSV65_19335 [Armatimonadota bacterium]
MAQVLKAGGVGLAIWYGAVVFTGFYIVMPVSQLVSERAAGIIGVSLCFGSSGFLTCLIWRAWLGSPSGRAMARAGLICGATHGFRLLLFEGSHWFFYGSIGRTAAQMAIEEPIYLALWMSGAGVAVWVGRIRTAEAEGDGSRDI